MKIKLIKKFVIDIMLNPLSFFELKKWYYYYKLKDQNTPLDHKIPWMTFGAIKYLNKYLNKEMNVFEYGSGGSTLFFSDKANHIISIEHDKDWYNYELEQLSKLNNLNLNLIIPETEGTLINYQKNYSNMYFDNYVNSIDIYDEKFDLIVVDGRQRNDCFKKALSKVKNGGIIVFDNFDREYYQKSLDDDAVNNFDILNFRGFVPFGTMQSLTTIFIKKLDI